MNLLEKIEFINSIIVDNVFFQFSLRFFIYIFLILVVYAVVRPIIFKGLMSLVSKSKQGWDDYLLNEGIFDTILKLLPLLLAFALSDLFFVSHLPVLLYVQRLLLALIILVSMRIFHKGIRGLSFFFQKIKYAQDLAIQSLCQVLILFIYFFGAILLVATIMGVSAWALLSGLGALTAVLMLVFKDTLMGFVASIQISLNRMLSVGDWIEMPQHGVDGNVLSLSLTNVKVQNWDKTVSTLPTSTLVHEVVKNWKGMEVSGGRRIKESLYVEVASVQLLNDTITKAVKSLPQGDLVLDKFTQKDGRYFEDLSNLSLFRYYVLQLLKDHDLVKKDLTRLLRLLPVCDRGIPIEFYFFISEQEWIKYEDFKADFISYLILLLPFFSLRLYQKPSSDDLQKFGDLT